MYHTAKFSLILENSAFNRGMDILTIKSKSCLDIAKYPTTHFGIPCLNHNFLALKMGVRSKNFWYQYWAQMLAPLPFEEDKRKLYYVKVTRCEYKWPASFPFHRCYILTIKCILTNHTNCEMYIIHTIPTMKYILYIPYLIWNVHWWRW